MKDWDGEVECAEVKIKVNADDEELQSGTRCLQVSGSSMDQCFDESLCRCWVLNSHDNHAGWSSSFDF